MELKRFLQTWVGTREENRIARWTLPGLSVATAVLAIHALTHEPTVIIEPPQPLESAGTVSASSADEEYLTSWGLHFAQLLGNIHRGNAEALMGFVDLYITSSSASEVRDIIAEQITRIRDEQATVAFSPAQIEYMPDEEIVAVTGTQTVTPRRGDPRSHEWTYEIKIGMERYRPQLLWLDAYKGPIRERDES